MTKDEQIAEALKGFFNSPLQTILATVKSIDKEEGNCIVSIVEGLEIEDVKLRGVTGTSGFLIYPAADSQVLISRVMNKEEFYISMFSEVESVIIQDGANGGLCITPELKTQLDKMTDRIDGIIDAIKNGVPIAQDGGVGYQTTMSALLDSLTNVEDFSNIENELIKH